MLRTIASTGSERFGGLFLFKRKASGDDIQGRVDVEWETGMENLSRLQFGVRHNNRDSRQQTVESFIPAGGFSFADLPFDPGCPTVACDPG